MGHIISTESLGARAVRYVTFLQRVYKQPALFTPGSERLKTAVRNYFDYKTEVGKWHGKRPRTGAPLLTLDCLWVWHAHMLRPRLYRRDCLESIGFVPAYATGAVDYDPQKSGRPWPEDVVERSDARGGRFTASLDLEEACVRQGAFARKVVVRAPGWSQNPNLLFRLQIFANEYQKFLRLCRENPRTRLVPTLAIDLIWHTHMLTPTAYRDDVRQVAGYFLDHNDNVPEQELERDAERTRQLWGSTYPGASLCGSTGATPTAGAPRLGDGLGPSTDSEVAEMLTALESSGATADTPVEAGGASTPVTEITSIVASCGTTVAGCASCGGGGGCGSSG